MAYLAYLRPRTFPITFVFVLTGYVLAPGQVSTRVLLLDLLFLFLVYSVLAWGGANAFNSAQDKDTGPVNLLPDPPPRPPHLGTFGLLCGLASVALPCLWPGKLRVVGPLALCLVLSIAYSWRGAPFRRLKEVGLADNVTNALGCGPLALLIGWGTHAPFHASVGVYALGFFIALFGGYTTTQIFQMRDGESYAQARNYTSLVGPARALKLGAAAFLVHVALLAPTAHGGPVAIVAFAAWALAVLMAAGHSFAWSRQPFLTPHRRMLHQLALMMSSQLFFLIGAATR
jgi:hypothetical protein